MEEGNGLPDMPKKASSTSSQGLPDMPVKKKVVEQPSTASTSTSDLEGGTSELGTGASALPKIDFEAARTYKVPAKTELGNKVIYYTKPSATIGLDEEASNKKLAHDYETKKIIDRHEAHKATAGDDHKLSAADFYLQNLKESNPEEYKYTIDKQEALSNEGDPLKIQEYHADLIKKSLLLKNRVMGGKLDLVSNNINTHYKPMLDDVDKLSKEKTSIETQLSGIDDFINQNFQKDANGQIITTPTNRKVAEDMLNKRNEFLTQLESNKTKLEEYANNQDFKDAMAQLDDIQKEFDSSASLYKSFAEKDPNAYKGLPELKKQIEKEQQAQFSKDLNEELTGGDLGIMEGSGRGATAIVKSLAYIPKNFGDDDEHGWTDKLYDNVSSSIDKFDAENNPLPTGYDKPVYENGEWNMRYLPGKLSQTIVEMAPMAAITGGVGATAGMLARGAASKELAYAIGSFAGEHVITVNSYYDQAREAGMSENDAQDFANKTATVQAMISMLSPDLKLLKGNTLGIEDYTKMIAQGVSKKEAAKQTAKGVIKNMMKEIPQESLQTWQEIQDQNAMYEEMGLSDQVKQSIKNDMFETVVVSGAISMIFGASGHKSASSLQKESLLAAASQPDVIIERGRKMLEKGNITQAQFEDLTIKVTKASEALQKTEKNLSSEKKADILPVLIEKNDLKEQKQNADDSQHDLINEQIKNKDQEIKNIIESPSKEEQEHNDFINGFMQELEKDEEKPVVEIPKSENEMQLEGLIEKDDSQKSEPIELNPEIESQLPVEKTEQEIVDEKIALLEQAREDLKKNEYFQEKIDYVTFRKRDNEIEKEINSLKKPSPESKKDDAVVEAAKPKEPAVKSEENTVNESEEEPVKEDKKPVVKKQDELIDEEAQAEQDADDKIEDKQDVLKRMMVDIEALKQLAPSLTGKTADQIKELAGKKYQAMIERAYRAKLDKEIKSNTYTTFRNAANDILGPKIAKKDAKAGEIKGQIDAIKEKIKEKLLGEGYKASNMRLMSAPGITPKTVEQLVDLAADLLKRGVDAGHSARKVIDKAVSYILSQPKYIEILKNEGVSEAKFRKLFESKVSDLESVIEDSKDTDSKEKTDGGDNNKNTESTENTDKDDKSETKKTSETPKKTAVPQENEKPVIDELPTNKDKQTKTGARFSASEKYADALKSVEQEEFKYKSVKESEVEKYVNSQLNKFDDGMMVDLANDMIKGNNPFPAKSQKVAEWKVIERLNTMSEEDGISEMDKEMLNAVSGKLAVKLSESINISATQVSLQSIMAKALPLSEKGVESFVNEKLKDQQESYMSEEQKESVDDIDKRLREMVEAEINRIAEASNGKEWVEEMDAKIDSLKIDLSEC